MDISGLKVLIKGAGDLATGIGWRLRRCGFQIIMTELEQPTTVRRTVAWSNAVYEGSCVVEGIRGVLVFDAAGVFEELRNGNVPVIVDPAANIKREFRPDGLVDAVIAKKNTGTLITDASVVIGVGPGFTAGVDCHLTVETKRGHFLGRVIEQGSAAPNTGVPGEIGGYAAERLIRAAADGLFIPRTGIGDRVSKDQIVAVTGGCPVRAQMAGMVRGMLMEGLPVTKGMKCGDIDAECELSHCFTISDKARAVGGGVLEALLYSKNRK